MVTSTVTRVDDTSMATVVAWFSLFSDKYLVLLWHSEGRQHVARVGSEGSKEAN